MQYFLNDGFFEEQYASTISEKLSGTAMEERIGNGFEETYSKVTYSDRQYLGFAEIQFEAHRL